MELELIDRGAVPNQAPDALPGDGAEDAHDAPRPGGGHQGAAGGGVLAPGAGVEVLRGVRVGVALQQLDVVLLAAVESQAVAANRGEVDTINVFVGVE